MTQSRSVAVCLVSLPERCALLAEAIESVYNQERAPDDIVVGIDPYRLGEVANMNRLIDATDAEWLAFLHDDDLWFPNHLSTAAKFMSDDVDVIVGRFELVGRSATTIEQWHEDWEDLRKTNWFPPSCVVARREVFGHWVEPEQPRGADWVDWCNWRRLLDAGARFVDTGEVTVQYRFGSWTNGSWHG